MSEKNHDKMKDKLYLWTYSNSLLWILNEIVAIFMVAKEINIKVVTLKKPTQLIVNFKLIWFLHMMP